MEKIIGLFFLLLILFVHPGCSSSPEPEKVNPFLEYPKELKQVRELIADDKKEDALLKIEEYLDKAENIHWYGQAYFLKAFLYETNRQFDEAIKYYLTAIQHGSRYESEVEARALYNLSFVYEELGRFPDMLVTLIDLMKREEYFNSLVGRVETPARLAAAYASQGQMKEALLFHNQASASFDRLIRNQSFKYPKEETSKSLYYLGLAIFDQNQEPYHFLLRKLSAGQKYYLAAAEASSSEWSKKASKRLENLYDRIWGMVNEFEPKGFDRDPLAKKKKKHETQLVMASDFYDLLILLRTEEFPLFNVNRNSRSIMRVAERWTERVEKFVMGLSLGPETVRSKKIRNKPLLKYIQVKEKTIPVNKESASPPMGSEKPASQTKGKDKKVNIGEDPNL